MAMTPGPLTDQQKTPLSNKHSAQLKSSKQDSNIYLPSQPIWFTENSSDEWINQDILSSKIPHQTCTGSPTTRTIEGFGATNLKPRYITITQQRPKPQVPVRYLDHLSDDDATSQQSLKSKNQRAQQQIHRLPWQNHHLPRTARKWQHQRTIHHLPVTARKWQRQRTILKVERSEHLQA